MAKTQLRDAGTSASASGAPPAWDIAQASSRQADDLKRLFQLARQRGKGAESYYRSDGHGNNAFVGGGCVSASSTVGSGDSKRTYDYYGSGC